MNSAFTVQDIYLRTIVVSIQGDGTIILDGKPVKRIFPHPDGTIELQTPSDEQERPLKYFLHGYQFWKIQHQDEEPTPEYAGQLEARLAYIRQIAASSTPAGTTIDAGQRRIDNHKHAP